MKTACLLLFLSIRLASAQAPIAQTLETIANEQRNENAAQWGRALQADMDAKYERDRQQHRDFSDSVVRMGGSLHDSTPNDRTAGGTGGSKCGPR